MNSVVLILCSLLCLGLLFMENHHYKRLFLSQIGYLYSNEDLSIEQYLNENFKEENTYYQQGLRKIETSTYQNNFQYFLNQHLYKSYQLIILSCMSIYIILTVLMIMYYRYMKQYRQAIIENLHYTESHHSIDIDNTLRKHFENHQQYIQYQIDKISQEKEFMYQFIMDVTHQLKTPLTSLQLMIENQKYEKQFDASKLENQIQKMNLMMTQLLNQGKLEAGKIEMHIEKNCFEELIDDMMSDLDELLCSYQIELKIECLIDTGYYDSYWLKEAIENIVKNCIEHSQSQQSIELKIKKDSQLIISIRDYAGGIADFNHLFERYYTTDYVKGVGLGLYLSHLIVSKHFGELNVSHVESGTLFIINIPDQLIM